MRSLVLALLAAACGSEPAAPPAAAPARAEAKGSPAAADAPARATLEDLARAIRNGRVPEDGVVTGGQPDEAALELAARAGVSAVIDLRGPDEPRGVDEAAALERLGIRYVALPVTGPDDLSVERARAMREAIEQAGGPVLVHCASGNRVGALFAVAAAKLDGRPAEEAIQVGRAHGLTHSEPDVRRLLAGE